MLAKLSGGGWAWVGENTLSFFFCVGFVGGKKNESVFCALAKN